MRGRSFKFNIDLRRRKEPVTDDADFTRLTGHAHVRTEHPVDVVHDTGGRHGARSARAFFRRLENEADAPRQFILVVHQPVREPQAGSRMGVVSASMHEPRDFRGKTFLVGHMLGIGRFRHQHAVHVKTKRRCGARAPRIQFRHGSGVTFEAIQERLRDTVFERALLRLGNQRFVPTQHRLRINDGKAALYRVTQLFQRRHDTVHRFKFRPAFFRALMDRAAQGHGFIRILLNIRHSQLSFRGLLKTRLRLFHREAVSVHRQ